MFLHVHPTRREALVIAETTLTRWALNPDRPTILASQSTAPWPIFEIMYLQDTRPALLGGTTGTLSGDLFALERPSLYSGLPDEVGNIELRRWDDLLPVHAIALPGLQGRFSSVTASSDGHWLAIGSSIPEWITLLDLRTGAISHQIYGGTWTTGLTFDPTSTLFAGVSSWDAGGRLVLCRLIPADSYVSPKREARWYDEFAPPESVMGSAALTRPHGDLSRTGVAWSDRDLGDAEGTCAFTPDSRLVIFNIISAYAPSRYELTAYDVALGAQLWCVRGDDDCSARFVLTPDGQQLLLPTLDGELLVYRVEDGALAQRLPLGLAEPVTALAFDHKGKTLWLATAQVLHPYPWQP